MSKKKKRTTRVKAKALMNSFHFISPSTPTAIPCGRRTHLAQLVLVCKT